ncbi:uncharacterized protein [Aristolochia californica]|uniref:uncharacterized protein n=1 Tax=Aristolochia californica TaxID=171875 RepID=UPI0035D7CD64
MEHRSGISFALLLLLLAPANCFTSTAHEGQVVTAGLISGEMYEIDYRGPETHSYIPPPDFTAGFNSKVPYTHHGKLHRKQIHG